MDQVNGKELACYCGLYCGACAIKNGQISNAANTLQAMLQAYEYQQWAPMLADFVPATKHYPEFQGVLEWLTAQDCPGCVGGGGNPACAIRLCAKEKGYAGCWECDEAGCTKLQEIDRGAPDAVSNRQRIREAGLETWLAEQAAKVEAGYSYFAAS
jgi:hypothetical protein